jgi:hypothetical protein
MYLTTLFAAMLCLRRTFRWTRACPTSSRLLPVTLPSMCVMSRRTLASLRVSPILRAHRRLQALIVMLPLFLPGAALALDSAPERNTHSPARCLTTLLDKIDCCSIPGVDYSGSSPICSIYSVEYDRCSTQDETLFCYPSEEGTLYYTTVVAQVMVCPNTKSSFINSLQYSVLSVTGVTLCFVFLLMLSKNGTTSVVSLL